MGKAKLRKTAVDIIKQNEIDKKKSFGIARNNFTGISNAGSSSLSGAINGSSAGTQQTDGFLKTSGDTMVGSLAVYLKGLTVSKGVINLRTAVGTNVASSTSRAVVIGEGSTSDDLEVILGATHAGQILFFQPIQAITLQSFLKTATAWADTTSYSAGDIVLNSSQRYTCHTAHTSATSTNKPATGSAWEDVWYRNNIRITGADDRVVAIDEIVLLQYDSTDSVWTIISGGGSSGGWDGDATSILDMNNYEIQHTGKISFEVTSGVYPSIDVSADSSVMNFRVNGIGAMALSEASGDPTLEVIGNPNPAIKTRSTDSTPTDDQIIGGLYFDAFNSALSLKTFGSLKMESSDVTSGSEDGAFMMNLMKGGTSTNVLLFDNNRLLPQQTDTYDLGGNANRFQYVSAKYLNNIEQLSFSAAISGQYINSSTAGLQYYVPSGDSHVFEVVSTPVVTMTATETTFADDVIVSGDLTNTTHNDNFTWSGTGYANISATTTYLYSSITYLGNSGGGDLTYIYSQLDFKANHSAVNETVPTESDGSITIKVGGINRKLYYYTV